MRTGARAVPALDAAVMSVPSEFRLEEYLPYRLALAAGRVSRLLAQRYSRIYGITIPEWRVLATIARFGAVSPSVICEWTAMDKVKVSRAAAALVSRNLARQSADPHDGRGRLLRLTRRGRAVYQGIVPLARELEESLSSSLGRLQWAALHKALDRLNAHLRSIDGLTEADAAD